MKEGKEADYNPLAKYSKNVLIKSRRTQSEERERAVNVYV